MALIYREIFVSEGLTVTNIAKLLKYFFGVSGVDQYIGAILHTLSPFFTKIGNTSIFAFGFRNRRLCFV